MIMMELKCKDCKYIADIGNTDETGAALCTRPTTYFPININVLDGSRII